MSATTVRGLRIATISRTDDLMFAVPLTDDRLKTKDEVVVTLLDGEDGVRHPLAIHVEFLEEKRLYQGEHAGYQMVVVTSEAGANRVYDAGGVRFARQLEDDRVADATGAVWAVEENALVAESDTTRRLPRVAAPAGVLVRVVRAVPGDRSGHEMTLSRCQTREDNLPEESRP